MIISFMIYFLLKVLNIFRKQYILLKISIIFLNVIFHKKKYTFVYILHFANIITKLFNNNFVILKELNVELE